MTSFPYRLIYELTAIVPRELKHPVTVSLVRGANTVFTLSIPPGGVYRWRACPGDDIIDKEEFDRVDVVREPEAPGVMTSIMFDIEPDQSLHPPSWRDWRFRWGYWNADKYEWDLDNDDPWWSRLKLKPVFYRVRRRVKPAQIWQETTMDGTTLTMPLCNE